MSKAPIAVLKPPPGTPRTFSSAGKEEIPRWKEGTGDGVSFVGDEVEEEREERFR